MIEELVIKSLNWTCISS